MRDGGDRHRVGLPLPGALMLTLLSVACGPGEPRVADHPCDGSAGAVRPDTGTVVVRGDDPPCSLDFREVVALRGEEGGELPKVPVALGPGGEWVTATYDPGEVAFWSATGELERVIGNGPGEGPGEFNDVTDLVVDTLVGELFVFMGRPYIEVYSVSGEYLRRIPVPAPDPVEGVLLHDGGLVTSASARGTEPELIVIRGDSASRVGPAQRLMFSPLLRPAGDGVWSADLPWYEVAHHAMPEGRIDLRIRREVAWFPRVSEEDARMGRFGPLLVAFAVDPKRALVFASVVAVEDPDAPRAPMPGPGSPGAATSPEEARALQRAYFDGVVEVFMLDGRLIASRRYDDGEAMPNPLTADFWGRIGDDASSIRILEPVLTERAR